MTALNIIPIQPGFTVSNQLQAADYAVLKARGIRLKARGIRTIINNRPDGEEADQLSAAEAGRLAAEQGMGYRHRPVTMTSLSLSDVEAFGQMLAEVDGPVHAHCRSGQRSATLWMLDQIRSGRMDRNQAQSRLAVAGIDSKPGLAWLDRQDQGQA